MLKKLLGLVRREQEIHACQAQVHFLIDDTVVPQYHWFKSKDHQSDTIKFLVHYYARILFELAELNETRVANELMEFVSRIAVKLIQPGEAGAKLQIPLGKLHLEREATRPAKRFYEANLYILPHHRFRLELQSVIGKENFYLPASFLALLQLAIDTLPVQYLSRLAQVMERLHQYYRVRRDYWEGTALTEGPLFALGQEAVTAAAGD